MRSRAALLLFLATLPGGGCGDGSGRETATPQSPVAIPPRTADRPVPPPRPAEPLARLEARGEAPVQVTAASVPGFQPLPAYRARVVNVSDRPVRRVVATVVYVDERGRALAGESHDVAFGSPLKAIGPGETLETSFLSRVEHAPGVRVVVRAVTLLGTGPAGETVEEWTNPRYRQEASEAGLSR